MPDIADNEWSESECRPGVWWYGIPGAGSYLWTAQYGTFWVGGGVYQKWASLGYECYVNPFIGVPVKEYGWIAEMNYGRGCYGQWFENGAIGYHDGAWRVMFGRYGQSGLRRVLRHPLRALRSHPWPGAEKPPDAPTTPPTIRSKP